MIILQYFGTAHFLRFIAFSFLYRYCIVNSLPVQKINFLKKTDPSAHNIKSKYQHITYMRLHELFIMNCF